MTYKATIGSISTGTLLDEDLIEAFSGELALLCGAQRYHRKLVDEADRMLDNATPDDRETASELVNGLQDALNEYAPAYGYFGTHEGDGADFGFWLMPDFQQMMNFAGVLMVNDTSEIPADFQGEVLHVNDHGNATFYVADNGTLTEIWSIV
jgi:hypothetical protein